MKKRIISSIITLFILSFYGSVRAQDWTKFDPEIVPEIGKKFNSFNIHDPENNKFFQDTIGKYYGNKYLILDFFSEGCTSCFASFPKLNAMQKKYRSKLQVLHFGLKGKYVRKNYAMYAKQITENIPVVFDSLFISTMVPIGFPHLVWIDKDGIVKAVTSSVEFKDENISKFLNDQPFDFRDKSHKTYLPAYAFSQTEKFDWFYDHDRANNWYRKIDVDTASLFKSEIGQWQDYMFAEGVQFAYYGPNKDRAILGTGSVAELYKFAYFGSTNFGYTDRELVSMSKPSGGNVDSSKLLSSRVYPKVMVDGLDSTLVNSSMDKKNSIYWYTHINRRDKDVTRSTLLKEMQADLKQYFGYKVHIEKRPCKYLALVKSAKFKDALIKTKGGKPDINSDNTSLEIENQSMQTLYYSLNGKYNPRGREVFLNETGIDYNVDIHLNGEILLLDSLKKMLSKYGLDIVEKEKLMDVLVLSPGEKKAENL